MPSSLAEQNKELVVRFNREFIEKNSYEAFQALVAEDFINHSAPPGIPNGPEGILGFMNMFHSAFTNVKVDIQDQLTDGDKVVTRKAIVAQHTGTFMGIAPTGKRVSLPVIDIILVKDGKYSEHWAVRDMASLMDQLKIGRHMP
jgi:predicted ester cyclase